MVMKLIPPSIEIIKDKDPTTILKNIERMGRICYKSEDKITDTSYEPFIKALIKRGHEAVIEHEKITAIVICDRGVTHEIVRHRIGSYCQESTRYCNYGDKEIEFIEPSFWLDMKDYIKYGVWKYAMINAEKDYKKLIELGATPQEARTVLPNSLKTEIAITYNLREWRHFFKLRCAPTAHPQMREVAFMLLEAMYNYLPIVFEDLYTTYKK